MMAAKKPANIGVPMVMNKAPANVTTLAPSVDLSPDEQNKPHNAKETAATNKTIWLTSSSAKETPPKRKAKLCSGMAAKIIK